MVIITISTGLLKSNQYCWRMNNNKCRCLRNRMEKLSLKYVTFFISNSLTTNLYTKICLLQSFYSKFKAFNDQLIRLKFSSHLRKINVVYFCGFLSRLKSILKKVHCQYLDDSNSIHNQSLLISIVHSFLVHSFKNTEI